MSGGTKWGDVKFKLLVRNTFRDEWGEWRWKKSNDVVGNTELIDALEANYQRAEEEPIAMPPAGAYITDDGQFYKWAGSWHHNTRVALRVDNPDLIASLEADRRKPDTETKEERADRRVKEMRDGIDHGAYYRQNTNWYRVSDDHLVENGWLRQELEKVFVAKREELTQIKPEHLTSDSWPKPGHDVVHHPSHYTSKVPPTDKHPNGIECYEVTMWFPSLVANVIKYCWRAGDKGDEIEDLRKAKQYIDFRIEQIEQQRKRIPSTRLYEPPADPFRLDEEKNS